MKKPAAQTGTSLVCGYKQCDSNANVKNSPHMLSKQLVKITECRALRPHCKVVKFCCQEHLSLCKKQKSKRKTCNVGCEALDVPQVLCLFDTLCLVGYAWAAVLMIVQLFLGERADAARSIRCSWLKHVLQDQDSVDLPEIWLPHGINCKTDERQIPLDRGLCKLLRSWIYESPLSGRRGSQWPWESQEFSGERCLFPGKDIISQGRSWEVPVSERAFFEAISKATKHIRSARADAEGRGEVHVFSDVDLGRVGTHAIKKTCVSLLSEVGVTMDLIGAITNTSPAVLRRHYDVATNGRKRRAMASALGPVVDGLLQASAEMPGHGNDDHHDARLGLQGPQALETILDRWCPYCGRAVSREWSFCYRCSRRLPAD